MLGTQTVSKNSFGVFIFVVLLILGLFYFPSIFKWWYEDDTFQYFYVSTIQNPISIFADAETMRKFSRAFAPMQILSYWIDYKIFGFSPLAANLHSFISFLLTSGLLFKVAEKLTKERLAAMGIVIVFLLLPSTLVVTQFIATRHYVEGLFFALLAIYFLIIYLESPEKESLSLLTVITLSSLVSICYKEIYATSILFLLFVLGIIYKRFSLVTLSMLLAVSYFSYRNWVFGTNIDYTMQLLGAKQYLNFLVYQTYTFSSNNWAYLMVIGITCLSFLMIKKYKREGIKEFGLFLGLIASLLLALYPVAYAVLLTYKTPGTWYRATFITNTVLAMWGVYSLSKIASKKVFVLILCFSLIPFALGISKTRKLWDEKMARAEMEAKFYLENPDKLLFSEEDASWFIDGVHKMYQVNNPHFINKQFLVGDNSKKMLSTYPTIWRYEAGNFVPDENLYQEIKEKNEIK